jgi:hypothetical protein
VSDFAAASTFDCDPAKVRYRTVSGRSVGVGWRSPPRRKRSPRADDPLHRLSATASSVRPPIPPLLLAEFWGRGGSAEYGRQTDISRCQRLARCLHSKSRCARHTGALGNHRAMSRDEAWRIATTRGLAQPISNNRSKSALIYKSRCGQTCRSSRWENTGRQPPTEKNSPMWCPVASLHLWSQTGLTLHRIWDRPAESLWRRAEVSNRREDVLAVRSGEGPLTEARSSLADRNQALTQMTLRLLRF